MHNLIETYLSEVERSLRLLPKTRRNEELREMRQHLQSAMTVYQEQGQSKDEAAQSAIAQFGSPDDLGQNIVQAWQRGQAIRRRDLRKSAACALLLSFLVPRLLSPLEKPFAIQASNAHEFLLVVVFYALPFLLAGMISGFVSPRQAVLGTGIGSSIWTLLILVLMISIGSLNFQVARGAHFSESDTIRLGIHYASNFAPWCGLATLAAILGAWIGSRGRGRQAQIARE